MQNLIDVTLKQKIKMKNFAKLLLSLALLFLVNVGWGQYVVNFEGAGETKTFYASGNVTLSGISWNLTEVLIGTSASDFKNGLRSARLRGYSTSAMTMNADKTGGIGVVSFNYRVYNNASPDGQVSWRVEYSTDGGTSWTQVGSNFTATTSVQTFSSTVNVSGNARIRIVHNSGGNTYTDRRMNIDDIMITNFPASPQIQLQQPQDVNQACGFTSNFGVVPIGTDAFLPLVIKNTGAATLTITSITNPSSPFSLLSIPTLPFDIAVGGSITINIQYSPSVLGANSSSFNIVSNSASNSTCSVNVAGTGVAANTGTIFNEGDIIVVAFNTNNNACSGEQDDFLTFISFKDIIPGTTFDMTDNGWQRQNANQWGNTEGTIRAIYNGAATITAGTKITFRLPVLIGSVPIATDWAFVNIGGTGATALNMNNAGDQIWFMQGGTWNQGTAGSHNATYTGGKIISGFNSKSTWTDFANATTDSGIYPNSRCFTIAVSAGFARYTSPTSAATQREWIDRIANPSNWTTYTNCANFNAASSPTFVITSGGLIAGKWLGGVSNNWFDCANWDDFRVPTNTTNVSIELTTGNNPTIDATAPFSDEFSDIAQARDLTILSSTSRVLTFPASGTHTLEIYGNWNNQKNETFFNEGSGTVLFRGSLNQTISTNDGVERFRNIVFNKTGGNISLSSTNVEISGTATFTAGVVNAPNATTARMEFLAGSSHTGASANSHVNGWVRKVGNTAFTFPVGDAGTYAPASLSAPSNTTDHFTAKYFKTSPHSLYNTGSLLSPLKNVSVCEYWIIDRTNGTSNVHVTLSYDDPRSCQTPNPAGLVVARWNGSQWVSEEQSAQTGTPTSGTITSNLVTSFSPFTLGNLTINPLPVELISFRGFVTTKGEAQLTWQVAAQINIKGYAVEKSLDNKNFEQIGFVDAQNLTTYNFFDAKFTELSYYRLRIVENDGSYRYSQVVSLDKNKTLTAQLLIYPNPAGEQDEIRVMIGGRDLASKLQAVVYGQSGKVLGEINASLQETESQLSQLIATQPKGLYIIYLQTEEGETLTAKFVKK